MTVNGKTKLLMVAMLFALAFPIVSIAPAGACYRCEPCTGTPGYWKTHPEEWPGGVTIGGVHYPTDVAIAIMDMPVKGDKRITMFKALAAAKLNVEVAGCHPDCVVNRIAEGDWWFDQAGCGVGPVRGNSECWQYSHGEEIYNALDAYNNGVLYDYNGDLCAAARE
jgi:hypothetical protein